MDLKSKNLYFAFFQDLKFNGNKLTRIPTEALRGPESLQNLQLQDNLIGKKRHLLNFFRNLSFTWDGESLLLGLSWAKA